MACLTSSDDSLNEFDDLFFSFFPVEQTGAKFRISASIQGSVCHSLVLGDLLYSRSNVAKERRGTFVRPTIRQFIDSYLQTSECMS